MEAETRVSLPPAEGCRACPGATGSWSGPWILPQSPGEDTELADAWAPAFWPPGDGPLLPFEAAQFTEAVGAAPGNSQS